MVLVPYKILAIELSKHLEDGEKHLLYKKFNQAYEAFIKYVPGCSGELKSMDFLSYVWFCMEFPQWNI